jgi:hypothetical protein
MSTTLPFDVQPRAYTLDQRVQEVQRPGAWPAPLSVHEEDLLIQKLGARGWVRMLQFTQFYGPGWGGGNKQLSPKGRMAFLAFLRTVELRDGANPSVFLTDDGELEMAWEDRAGKPVQLVFGPQGVLVYVEATAREELVPYLQLKELAASFANV